MRAAAQAALSSGRSSTLRSDAVTNHPIKLLAIDLKDAAPALREALVLERSELEDLVKGARLRSDVELVLVSQSERFELYSTEASHALAFRSVLVDLVVRAGGRENLRHLRTLEVSGVLAARHLLRHAAGIE